MTAVTFPLWDAPHFGAPWIDPVATQWSSSQLISVTLNRAQTNGKDDLPDLAVSTMDPALHDTTHQGLVSKALLEFAPRLMAAQAMSAREAAETLIRLSREPGTPISLTVGDSVIDALWHDVPATGDWVVAAFDHNHRVCVAGRRGITVPTLEPADMAEWDTALSHQIAAVTSETDAQ